MSVEGGDRFKPGERLTSYTGKKYEILEQLGGGFAGITYRARVVSSDSVGEAQTVVVKTPLLDPTGKAMPDIIVDHARVYSEFIYEWNALSRLKGLDYAAEILDYGTFEVKVSETLTIPAVLFMVQRFIEGVTLGQKMLELFPAPVDNRFRGIPDGDQFIGWATRITRSLSAIHQRQVVHGDIHQENIMVDSQDIPVFIDFGQSLLRDIAFPGEAKRLGSTARFVPPENTRSIAGDIFSLGGVFFYLATGELPPEVTENDRDIELLKDKITSLVKLHNESLFWNNRGVTDVIARSMRFSQEERVPNTDGVLEDLESISPNFSRILPDQQSPEDLSSALAALDRSKTPLFSAIARCRIRALSHAIEHMSEGAYDLSGDHEAIVTGMTEYLACLGPGDSYLTISLPSFWSKRNLGTNGRYLTANVLAAQRRASIRRIFLITPEDDEEEIRKIFVLHQIAQTEVEQRFNVQNLQPTGQEGGLYTAFQRVDKNALQALGREGRNNYGLLLSHDGKGLLIVPVYRNDGVIVTIQFRSDSGLVSSYREDFSGRVARSSSLTEFLGDASMLSRTAAGQT